MVSFQKINILNFTSISLNKSSSFTPDKSSMIDGASLVISKWFSLIFYSTDIPPPLRRLSSLEVLSNDRLAQPVPFLKDSLGKL